MKILYGILPGILISFGMGGGSLLIYILNIFEEYSQQKIQYINLWLYIIAGSISVFSYWKNKKINFKNLKILLPISIILCIIFSIISKNINSNSLKKYFGYFLIFIGIWQLFQILYKYIKNKFVQYK
ncbi:MAG: hypothetical protein E7311_04740 [Clostridiales bacterium]|nr:hypothetical protein [Clostridiales bacterium]